MKPIEIINNIMLDTMKEIGVLFGAGKMLLPFVLQSAETMKAAVSILEPHMEKGGDTETRGKVVLATVKGGDVHDIGKNLVDIILSNNGYEVHNLGIKISVEEMIAKALEIDADAIGMSGLLVKSTNIMRDNIDEMKRQGGLDKKVLLGGAALTEKFVNNDCIPIMPGKVSYCRDAFDALKVLSGEEPAGNAPPEKTYSDITAKPKEIKQPVLEEPKSAPFIGGVKTMQDIDMDAILEYMNKLALFSHRWGGYSKKGMADYEYDALLKETVIPEFNETVQEIKENSILEMGGIKYGYFKCNSDGGEDLIIYDGDSDKELTRFMFPRQNIEKGVSLADYFQPVSSGKKKTRSHST